MTINWVGANSRMMVSCSAISFDQCKDTRHSLRETDPTSVIPGAIFVGCLGGIGGMESEQCKRQASKVGWVDCGEHCGYIRITQHVQQRDVIILPLDKPLSNM
jgi:hypothetical protein